MDGALRIIPSQPLGFLAPKTASGGKIRAHRVAPERMPRNRLYRPGKTHLCNYDPAGPHILGNTIGNAVAGSIASSQDTSAQGQGGGGPTNLLAGISVANGGDGGASVTNYTIKAGDDLSKIALNMGVKVDSIIALNANISDPNLIYEGDNLVIPPAEPNLLVQEYLSNHVTHQTRSLDSSGRYAENSSDPTPQLIQALTEYASTPLGQQIIRYENSNAIKQLFVYDPTIGGGAEKFNSSEISYNPANVGGPEINPGDQHQSETLTVAIAHEFGHTEVGRDVLGLPTIPYDVDPTDPSAIVVKGPNRRLEETIAVYYFENPIRNALNLPLRSTYYKPGDVIKKWGQ